jgi:ABC-2 type transport system ATP-binding protein
VVTTKTGIPAIEVVELGKRFGKTQALDGLNFVGVEGQVLGVLGPNGAGKTTAVRILSTLLKPNAGQARVFGVDVVQHPTQVRSMIGLTGQYAAVDEFLTGRENLEMMGRLFRMAGKAARARAEELLTRFDLVEAAGRPVKTYSGGMRRRLDIAASLIAKPRVMFLDEPTTGLDPRSRIAMWSVISELVSEGATMLLTTQYMEEADQLADNIVVIDHGKVIAEGSPAELKISVGGERLEITVGDPTQLGDAATAISNVVGEEPTVDSQTHTLRVPVKRGTATLPEIVRELDAKQIAIEGLSILRPTLDDVFLSLTGSHVSEEDDQNSKSNKGENR